MKGFAWASFILIAGMVLQPGSITASASAMAHLTAGPRPLVTEESDGLLLEWSTPPLLIQQDVDGYARLEISGYSSAATPGQYQTPQTGVLVALPPGADPTLTILDISSTPLNLPGLVRTVPQPGGWAPETDVPGTAAVAPVLKLEEIGIQRGVRLARITFSPVQPAVAGWQLVQNARARIRYHRQDTLIAAPARDNTKDPILGSIINTVINPGQVLPMKSRAGSASSTMLQDSPGAQAAIEVKERGLTQITYEALKAAGFPVDSVGPQYVQLWRGGNEIALEWDGNADAVFAPGERFVFYANPRFSRWMDMDFYWLKAGAQPGKRIASREGGPNGQPQGVIWRDLLVEKNVIYTPDCKCGILPAGRDGDRWVWDSLTQPGRPTRSYSFSIPSVDPLQPGKLTLWMIGYTSLTAAPDHRVDAMLNGTGIGFLEWDGKQAASIVLDLPAGQLKSGQNTLTLTVPARSGVNLDGVWLDAFQVRYAQGSGSLGTSAIVNGDINSSAYTITLDQISGLRVYDVQTPDAPVRLLNVAANGNQASFGDHSVGNIIYAVASEAGLRQPTQVRMRKSMQTAGTTGADYLVITHPDFAPALSPLLQLRASRGLSTAVENVEAIYDQYGEGQRTPEAIRAFIADTYQHWSPRPQYVLLVGDGTNDPRRYHTDSAQTWVPPMLSVVDPWMGETAADNRYVAVDGTDALPDMAIGRLPVNSLAEAQAVVAKLVAYETQPDFGPWMRRFTFIADDADESGDFAQLSEDLAKLLPAPFQSWRAYYQPPLNTSADIQQAILNQFNAGSGVIVFTGHASIHQWAAENFLHISQVPLLTNSGKLPLLLEMDCETASFQVAGFTTLDEALLLSPQGGVVAAWGPTGLGIATGHETLAKSVIQNLVAEGRGMIGLDFLQAKMALSAQGSYLDLIDTYTLLGDPASVIDINGNSSSSNFLPLISQ